MYKTMLILGFMVKGPFRAGYGTFENRSFLRIATSRELLKAFFLGI